MFKILRHLIRFIPKLPQQAAFALYNYIIGYVVTEDKGIFVTHIGQYGYMSHFDQYGKPKGSPIICNGPNHIMQLKNQRIVGNNQSNG